MEDGDIVELDAADRRRIESHFLNLSAGDRSLRFSAGVVPDEVIRRYVDHMALGRDLVLGCVDADGRVLGLMHGAVFEIEGRPHIEAAFSVDESMRGKRLGSRLMAALVAHVAATGGCTVVGSCAAHNLPMRRIFANAGMELVREEDEWIARREVGPASGPAAVRSSDPRTGASRVG